MTIIFTEMLKWKRNKTVWGIFILTAILGLFAVERACSISRNSPIMDSFGDLYTLAFKNLTSLFLPIVLGMFATTLFFDEQKNDTLKGLLIIPVSKTQLYFSKTAVVLLMSLGLCLFTFVICIVGGFIAGGFTDLNVDTILQAGVLFLAGGLLIPVAMLPILFLATLSKGYVLPIGATLLYLMIFSVLIYLLLFAITFAIEAALHFRALSFQVVLGFFITYFINGLGIFFAISPIIALVAHIKKGYLPALIFAEIYSFAGLFASMSETLKTVYPITAVFKLSGYYKATIRDKTISLSLLFICAVFAIFILAGLNQRQLSARGRHYHES